MSTHSKLVDHLFNEDLFHSALLCNISTVSPDEYLLVCGDLNDHVGKAHEIFNGIHAGTGLGSHNADGIRILDLCAAANLAITTTCFNETRL